MPHSLRRKSAAKANKFIRSAAKIILGTPFPEICRKRRIRRVILPEIEIDISPVESRVGYISPAPPPLASDDDIVVNIYNNLPVDQEELEEGEIRPQVLTREQIELLDQVAEAVRLYSLNPLVRTQKPCDVHTLDETEIPANCTRFQCQGVDY